jgi:hypothetical protein
MCTNKPVKSHIFTFALYLDLEAEPKHESSSKGVSKKKCCLYYKLLHEHIRLWDNTTGWLSTLYVSAVGMCIILLQLHIHSTYKFFMLPFDMRNNRWQLQSNTHFLSMLNFGRKYSGSLLNKASKMQALSWLRHLILKVSKQNHKLPISRNDTVKRK